jgi:hypothetical protein
VEYTGQEMEVTIYWNVDMPLSAGEYRVEIFADNYRLGSKIFVMK